MNLYPTHFAGDYSRGCCGVFCSRNLHQKQLQARQTADDIIKQGQKKQIISKRKKTKEETKS